MIKSNHLLHFYNYPDSDNGLKAKVDLAYLVSPVASQSTKNLLPAFLAHNEHL
ncbi:Uncharacterised protein [Streptococcus pneumoniae]|nr:Uncharacterised protein [Streptococcus pneumoniae]